MTETREKKIWHFVDNLGGDKVVWIITLLLILFSIVCIFSASSRLLKDDMTRLDIAKDQIQTVLLGLGALIFCYNIRKVEIFRVLSHFGFLLSLGLLISLLVLTTDPNAPIHAGYINGAVRSIVIKGVQFHIFEVVKVAMVLYFAWYIGREQTGGFPFLKWLSAVTKQEWINREITRKVLLLYLPFVATLGLVAKGSNSSAIFMAVIFLLTIGIGEGQMKDVRRLLCLCLLGGTLLVGLTLLKKDNKPGTDVRNRNRVETLISRIHHPDYEKQYLLYHRQSDLDKIRQPYSARIAIHDSKVIGKGPGQSTQRYVVPDMPEDFMFSFIVEEYGIFGGLLVIILYTSLMARGVLIVKNCGNNVYAKVTIAGLILLICGQAFMHIIVNCDFGFLTGQTLPLLSHGASAFLCFSVAFGIILSISRIANKGIEKDTKAESLDNGPIQSVESNN